MKTKHGQIKRSPYLLAKIRSLYQKQRLRKVCFQMKKTLRICFLLKVQVRRKVHQFCPANPQHRSPFLVMKMKRTIFLGSAAAKKQTSSLPPQSQEKAKPSEQPPKKASALFSSDEEDQWSVADSQTKLASERKSKGERWDAGTNQGQEAKAVKKTNLFEEEDDDGVDLFAIAKDSQKKTQRTSLLFEDDTDSGSSLFSLPPTSVPPAATKKESIPKVPLLFSDEEDSEVPSGVKPVDLKAENAAASPEVGSADVANVAQKEGLLPTSDQEAGGPLIYFLLHLHWTKEPRVGPKLSLVCLMRTRTK